MTRRIVLELGGTTTETCCGDCQMVAEHPGYFLTCVAFEADLAQHAFMKGRRLDSCRESEGQFAKLAGDRTEDA